MYSENDRCLIYSPSVKTYMLDFLKARYTLKYPGCVLLLFWPREDEGTGVTVYSLNSFLSPLFLPQPNLNSGAFIFCTAYHITL